jgi:hypothetical protein
MDTIDIFVLVLAISFVVYTVWRTLPRLIWSINPATTRQWFLDSSASNQVISASRQLRNWSNRLASLGFSQIGVKAETSPLRGSSVLELALVSVADNTFASIVLDQDGHPYSLYFYTPFTNNGIVFTRNGEFAPETEDRNTSVKNVVSNDFNAIFTSHKERVQSFVRRGFTPLVDSTKQSRIEATRLYYVSSYGRHSVRRLLSSSDMQRLVASILLLIVAIIYLGMRALGNIPR